MHRFPGARVSGRPRASRFLTENAPKPRSSTRRPIGKGFQEISSKMVEDDPLHIPSDRGADAFPPTARSIQTWFIGPARASRWCDRPSLDSVAVWQGGRHPAGRKRRHRPHTVAAPGPSCPNPGPFLARRFEPARPRRPQVKPQGLALQRIFFPTPLAGTVANGLCDGPPALARWLRADRPGRRLCPTDARREPMPCATDARLRAAGKKRGRTPGGTRPSVPRGEGRRRKEDHFLPSCPFPCAASARPPQDVAPGWRRSSDDGPRKLRHSLLHLSSATFLGLDRTG